MITLTTDFGTKDPYVAEMKGVILQINPNAKIIDITHEVPSFDIQTGAFILASAAPYFPVGTVHVAVVDPGVGTKRHPILIKTSHSYFIGPDNGLLSLAAKRFGVEAIYQIENPKYMLPQISSTFHGRDIFAPAAAHLDQGIKPELFGRKLTNYVIPDYAVVTKTKKAVIGRILHIDNFGNIISNISFEETNFSFDKLINVKLANRINKLRLAKTYADAKSHEAIVLPGSHGFLEIAENLGNASERFKVKAGDYISVSQA